jgi:polyvinyl alcohol dehydrogenase (cytochrome)
MRSIASTSLCVVGFMVVAATASAQTRDGATVFQAACAMCHAQPAADSRAPNLDALRQFAPETILTALTTGNMFRQGSELTDADRRAVAAYLAGRPVGAPAPASTVGRCTAAPPRLTAAAIEAGWSGWGAGVANTRFLPAARTGLPAQEVPKLKLKWAFGFAGASSARAQPAVVGGRVFVGSENGDLYALDAKTGCTHWTYHAQAGIRTAVSVGPYAGGGASGFAAYFADGGATAYAIDAATGKELWRRRVDDHPYAKSTGSPTLYNGRLYVPAAGVGEEGQGGSSRYGCCTFRGSVSAVDANTGRVVWKSYTISEEPKPRGTSKDGVQLWGPAGAGVWSSPTVDARRRAIYVTTGNGYAEPATRTSDAVLALDMETGRVRWVYQPTVNDVFAGGCRAENPDNPNCPPKGGPDHDFSMSPVLARRSNGQDVIIVHQKSGMVYALDPDKEGAVVWQYRASAGNGLGGQWGAAVDDKQAYVGVNAQTPGGVRAVKIDTGEEVWSKPASERLCGTGRGCSAAQGAAVSVIPGVVFSGSMDGGIRAYSTDNGTIVWQFDTNRTFDTVNGVKANGGAMDGPGAVVSGGMMYISSGYVSLIGRPGNVLLAFGVD